jgi:class 3 adenylate cyclase
VGEETGLLAEAVRDLVRTLPEIIERHRGVAVSLDEIGLVALFGLSPRGVPVAVSALLAGHAALAIGEHVSGITLGGEENGKLTMSAGLDTGDVLAFPVGGMDHRTWVGLGGTLEVAKALDTLGKNNAHGGLAMSGSAYEALAAARQQFEFGRYGRVRLGNPGPEMMVYEVIGRKASLVRHRTASL